MRERVLEHLRSLVGFATPNPPRAVDGEHPLFGYLLEALGTSFDVTVTDLGDGCVSLFAVRGAPKTLYNFHVDTVPVAAGYSGDPYTLRVEDDRAIGLGACDIKGASAAMLAALEGDPSSSVALLFTSDEENGRSTCVREFCDRNHAFDLVVVAEPTEARAVVEHRGIMTGTARFAGVPGHASLGNADRDSAVHHAVRWANQALDFAQSQAEMRLNLGRVEGGVKPNMIAAEAEIRFGFRPLPGADAEAMFQGVVGDATVERGFIAPSLPANGDSEAARSAALQFGLDLGDAVDFWTEAALFSAAGYPTFVMGPGDIAQAHTADEWVAIDQLTTVANAYARMLKEPRHD